MASLSYRDVQSFNTSAAKSRSLIAVFTGATSGIGRYTVHALARAYAASSQSLRAYIVGRSSTSADAVLTECRKACPHGEFIFVQVKDLSLLCEVDELCKRIATLEKQRSDGQPPHIDLLVMTHAVSNLTGHRQETKEGLDRYMSELYYSRMRIIISSLPLLLASSSPARVVSVFAAGSERLEKWHDDDPGLRSPSNYGFGIVRDHTVIMKTLFFEHLAQLYAGRLSFVHVFPGLVWGPGMRRESLPAWFRVISAVVGPLINFKPVTVPPAESGDRTLFLGLSPRYPPRGSTPEKGGEAVCGSDETIGSGAYSLFWKGTPNDIKKVYDVLRAQGLPEKVVMHTQLAMERIAAGQRFDD